METELLLVFMAGIVLALFLIVIEIAAMRKPLSRIKSRLLRLYQTGRILKLLIEITGIAAFFMIQPVIVAFLVTKSISDVHPDFSRKVIQELRQVFSK
jgi:hypothetical protein